MLRDLQNSYLNSLKTLTSSSKQRKIADEKKDDELTAKQNKYSFEEEKKAARKAFPVTINMFFASLCLWVGIGILIYYTISYGFIYARIKQEQDLEETCQHNFSPEKDGNFKKIENYSLGDAGAYLARLKFKPDDPDYPMESNTLPPVVTAVTSEHFHHVQGLIRHIMEDIRPSQSDFNLIVFDFGLNARERELMQKYCHCEMRDFDFASFPSHVGSYHTYAWRPILLQQMLLEFGAVMYIDPTTRFKNPSSPNYLRMRGSQSYFLWDYLVFTPLIAYTDMDMFKYFNEHRCTFRECTLLSPEAIVLYRTAKTWEQVMKPWLKCALNLDCISPKNALYKGCFEIRMPRTTGCHRYDMSALSIVLNRGRQYTIGTEHMMSYRLTYTLHEPLAYFPEQPWTYTHIFLIVLAPVLAAVLFKYVCSRRNRFKFC